MAGVRAEAAEPAEDHALHLDCYDHFLKNRTSDGLVAEPLPSLSALVAACRHDLYCTVATHTSGRLSEGAPRAPRKGVLRRVLSLEIVGSVRDGGDHFTRLPRLLAAGLLSRDRSALLPLPHRSLGIDL